MKDQVCVICFEKFSEYGNNAEPVKKGRCCNVCNDTVVIPERIRIQREEKSKC